MASQGHKSLPSLVHGIILRVIPGSLVMPKLLYSCLAHAARSELIDATTPPDGRTIRNSQITQLNAIVVQVGEMANERDYLEEQTLNLRFNSNGGFREWAGYV
jgi:hypothetical protein